MNLLKRMSIDLATISACSTVDQASDRMAAVGLSDLLVVDGCVLRGVITASQIAAHRNSSCPTNGRTLVRTVMTRRVPRCGSMESERKLVSRLETSPVGLLLVLDRDRQVLGVIRQKRRQTSLKCGDPGTVEPEMTAKP